MSVRGRYVDGREGKGVCDFEGSSLVHTHDESGRRGGEGLSTMFDYLHDHLTGRKP